jgi:hypothetical protein
MRKFSNLQSQLQISYFLDQRRSQLKLTSFTWGRFRSLLLRISSWETDMALHPKLLNVALFCDSFFHRNVQPSSDTDVLHKFTFSKYWSSKLDPTLRLVTVEQWKSTHFMFVQEHPTDIIILSVQLHGNPSVFKFASDHNAVTSNCSGCSSVTPTNIRKSGTSDTRGCSSTS